MSFSGYNDDISRIIDKMRHIYPEPVKLHSGGESKVKFEIERLDNHDLAVLAGHLPQNIDNVSAVVSVGGGKRFAS